MKAFMKDAQLFTLLLTLLLLSACMPATSIREVLDNPREYSGKKITVAGTVANVYSLFFIKYFELNDGTGVIGVITEKPLPKTGEHLKVTGTLQEAFSLGDKTMTVLVEKDPKQHATNNNQ